MTKSILMGLRLAYLESLRRKCLFNINDLVMSYTVYDIRYNQGSDCSLYNFEFQRIFVQGATWPFHMVMFFTIMGWLCVSILYILFTSGYHRRRKRKPWPSYELYFNA